VIRFYCPRCAALVFFDSNSCEICKIRLVFNPAALRFEQLGESSNSASGRVNLCRNGSDYGVCNWLAEQAAHGTLCYGCSFNRTIPNLTRNANIERWKIIEEAKKRLLFSVIRLGLSIRNGWEHPDTGLLFDFLEDKRCSPAAESPFVTTGFFEGVITLNILEADPAMRFAQQKAANEVYRTVIGHLRHEIGHYFYTLCSGKNELNEKLAIFFGDSSIDYAKALNRFYLKGPMHDWTDNYITPYASAHPLEDWAETFGHYLHIHDALETAASYQLINKPIDKISFDQKISDWRSISIGFNELNRSMGLSDAYPFVISERVAEKLRVVDDVIRFLKMKGPD